MLRKMAMLLALTLIGCNSQPTEMKDEGTASSAAEGNATAGKVVDPVCGMKINPSEAARQTRHGGKLYHFCSEDCLKKFEADPQKFVASKAAGKAE